MKVIFNADDFGYSKGVNLGIIESYQNGLVRSATIMANMPGFTHAVALATQNPGLGIGVHLTLTAGNSIGGVYKTLTDETGAFLKLSELERRAKASELDLSEIEAEYEAQITKVLMAGITPDHFDGHHHTQNLPGIVDVFLKQAKKYGVKVRIKDTGLLKGEYAEVRSSGAFSEDFFGDTATEVNLKGILTACKAKTLEVMCHPAYVDSILQTSSSYNVQRVFELELLTAVSLKEYVSERGLTLCAFNEI